MYCKVLLCTEQYVRIYSTVGKYTVYTVYTGADITGQLQVRPMLYTLYFNINLINNAGIVSGSPILETSDERIIKTFEVNSFAHLWTIKSFLPGMLESKLGHIVSVASVAGHGGAAKLVDYCGSKFAAVGIDEAFRVELYTQGHSDYIKTTCVSPYYTNTGMFDGVHSKVLPILEPEYVADRAVAAILTNREILLLPWWGMFLLLLKVILPSRGFMKVAQAFGFNCAMDQFTGRKKTD